MLTLSRKVGEKIMVGDNIVITVVRVEGRNVRIGVEAPKDIPVHRFPDTREVDRQQKENGNASGQER